MSPDAPFPFFALTTRGLEAISAAEMGRHPAATLTQVAYRRVLGQWTGEAGPLLALRTVDDLFLHLATWPGMGRPRQRLDEMRRLAATLDLAAAAARCATVRAIPQPPTFSVSASFVGKRNYSSEEMKQALAEGVVERYDWPYSADERASDLNLRLFIEHEEALVGVRLSRRALHDRPYKVAHRAGSLKPPVAAAMLELAALQAGERFHDPFCGAGTLVIEAACRGALATGSDHDAEAVAAARANLDAAALDARVEHWDARALPLDGGSVACIASNLPWGRQVTVEATLAALYADACREMERLLVPGGRMVLLTSVPELLRFERLLRRQELDISLFGQRAALLCFAAPARAAP